MMESNNHMLCPKCGTEMIVKPDKKVRWLRTYTCPSCGYKIMNMHYDNDSGNKNKNNRKYVMTRYYYCKLCSKLCTEVFNTEEECKEHLKKEHNAEYGMTSDYNFMQYFGTIRKKVI